MKCIGQIKEIYGDGYPSLRELISDVPFENKENVLHHMKNAQVTAAAAGVFRDILTGEVIPAEALCLTDGEYYWRSDIAYYVERYNMRLPQEFIEHAVAEEGRQRC